jgi:hypothetical protein
LVALSDPTTEPIPAATIQGAFGAWKKPVPASAEATAVPE